MSRVALITGASSGIGKATAVIFAKRNIHVVGIARRAERLAEVQTEIEKLPEPHGQFLPVIADVTDVESIEDAVRQAQNKFGHIDILVANAGVGHRGAVVDAEWAELETVLRTNIDGVLHCIRAVAPYMQAQKNGHIFIISSVVHNIVSPYATIYAASKAFINSLAHSLRMELEDDHIQVTDVVIGRTHTEFNENRLGKGKLTGQSIPTMSAEDVANAIFKAVQKPKKTVYVRFFDRLTILGSILIPQLIGRIAKKQYK